jgi:hypothetical protein
MSIKACLGAWHQILSEWKDVARVKSLSQQLYDQLVGGIIYILQYAEKNSIILPNRDCLDIRLNTTEKIIDDINHMTSDDCIQPTYNHPSEEEQYRTLSKFDVSSF